MKYFTSDTHFGHANVIKYCNRPFASADEMNAVMLKNWNDTVKPDDTIYHLGDFAFLNVLAQRDLLKQLNGYKILILGNHDRRPNKMKEFGFNEVHPNLSMNVEDIPVRLCHYPYQSDTDMQYEQKFHTRRLVDEGGILIHGHVHDRWKVKGRMVNVGVDVWNFKPVAEHELAEFLRSLP